MSAQSADPVVGAPSAPAGGSRANTVVFTLMVAVFLSLLDTQIVATALPRMVSELGGLDLFAWVTTGYLIGGSAAVPIYGKLGDLFGRKRVFVVSIVVFLVGSLACGLATSMTQLIVFRVIQGIGSGGLFISVLSIIGEMFSPREGARYYGWFSITFGAASLAGPTIGGILTDFAGWRWVFLVNLPIGVVALLVIITMLDLPARITKATIDYAGVILLVLAIVGLNLLTGWAGSKYAWGSPVILGLAAGSVIAVVLFILSQHRAVDPIMPLRLFRNSTFSIAVTISFIAGFVGLGIVNYLVLWLQTVLSLGVQESGYVLAAMMLGVVVTSYVTTKIIARTGSYRWYPVLSMVVFAVAAVLFATAGPSTGLVPAVVYMLLFGVAGGLNSQALSLAVRNTASYQDIGATQGTATMLRQMGTALGVSLFAALMTSRLTTELNERLGSGSGVPVDKDGSLSPEVLGKLSAEVRLRVSTAYADALQTVFLAVIPIVLVGFVVSLFLKDVKLAGGNRRHSSDNS
ncbi:drug resistance transporter, EmrB/QacA subfamily [Lentzea albidocapillata subsp. violacea]|uniref:Drug resistance transporter, EmrB/QacA subfamily n=1 Tax=Lentzea albidocapillata subsp. violacea TaxID=128104 RepID=A0A1G9LQV5_9PSEU|nr:MDR family MFS transporter [Lentzea albidocapillata]SDL64326.1 drug resistance transporter, EmrB/QacA subfamily [Lentzea albidocapillata subsp. violacea]